MKTIQILVQGQVQGVFFRASCQQIARSLGLTGWVRNLPDGSVEILAQGLPEKLDAFLKWCRQGPEGARVDRIGVKDDKADRIYERFEIVYGKDGDL